MDQQRTDKTFRPKRLIAVTAFCACILLAATGLATTTSTQRTPVNAQDSSPSSGNHLVEDAANPYWTGATTDPNAGGNMRGSQSGAATITAGDESLR